MSLRNRAQALLALFPAFLARLGLVDRRRGEEAFDLAVPAMVTGGLRTLLRTADFFMVSIATGSTAVAALEIGFQYYFIPFGLALALVRHDQCRLPVQSADDHAGANFAIKQSLWLALLVSLPITAGTWVYADSMIGLLNSNPEIIELGAAYLRVVMLTVVFRFWG